MYDHFIAAKGGRVAFVILPSGALRGYNYALPVSSSSEGHRTGCSPTLGLQ